MGAHGLGSAAQPAGSEARRKLPAFAAVGTLVALAIRGAYNSGVPLFPAAVIGFLAAIGGAGLVGFFNGVIIAKLKVPAFIVTLGSSFVVRGISLLLSENTTVIGLPAGIRSYGNDALVYYIRGEGGGLYFLSRPEVVVKLWESGAKEPKSLLLQPSTEKRDGKPTAVAAVQGQGPVVLVEGKALAELTPSVSELRDRTLIPAFEPSDVKRARVVSGGEKLLVVEKSGETEWKQVEPVKGSTKDGKVASLLVSLLGLRWKEIASKGGEDARFGLDKPELEVTAWKADGTELATLLVGRTDGAVTYVKLKSQPGIYAMSSKDLDDVRRARADIPA